MDNAMTTRELFRHSQTAQLLFDIWDSYAALIGPQQSRLTPKGTLVFELIERQDAQGFVRLVSPIRLVVMQNPTGYYLFFGSVRLSRNDARNDQLVPPGTYRLRISHPDGFYQTVVREVVFPTTGTPYQIALEPGGTYPYLPTSTGLRGRVIDPALPANADGFAGVRIVVTGFPSSSLTDRDGGWVYYLPEPDRTGSLPNSVEIQYQHPNGNVIVRNNAAVTVKKVNPVGNFQF